MEKSVVERYEDIEHHKRNGFGQAALHEGGGGQMDKVVSVGPDVYVCAWV